MKKLDLAGTKLGRITVIAPGAPRHAPRGSQTTWECRCDCGNRFTATTVTLRNGHTRSCGCLSLELKKERSKTHGLSKSRTYSSWWAMINRCNNKNIPNYSRYGAQGISVCDRWLKFENFLADMGERPDGSSIDRINNSGNYSPENCRWATAKQQCENRRSTRWIEHGGLRLSVSEWSRRLGINQSTLLEALEKHPIDIALRKRTTRAELAQNTGGFDVQANQ